MEQHPKFYKIERSISWLGVMVLAIYTIAACACTKLLLPHRWRRLDVLGAAIIVAVYLLQNLYWGKPLRKGIRLLKQNQWEAAYVAFKEQYNLFEKRKWEDRFRYWFLISISSYSYQAMALRNMAFCQIMMRNKEQAKFYYDDLLQLPKGRQVALPLLKYFE